MRVFKGFFIAGMMLAAAATSWAAGRAPVPLTLVAVPAEYTPLQIGQDLASRYPTVLVSYQEDPNVGGMFLHAWDGSNWRPVTRDEFGSAGFVKMTPKRTVIIGSGPTASTLVDLADGWCPEVLNLASTKSADIVNTMGRLFQFNKSEWRWFAGRYQMGLNDLNEGRRNESWYDQPYTDPERSSPGSVVAPPVRPTSHNMTWPPSAPAVVEKFETVGTVETVERAPALDLSRQEIENTIAVPTSQYQPASPSTLKIRPPSFRGWETPPADSISDIK